MDVATDIGGFVGSSYTWVTNLIQTNGYLAIFGLMTLEAVSLPLPSEVIIPVSGYLSAKGVLNPFLAWSTVLLGAVVGTLIAYYIGYYVGKGIIYKHLQNFRIKKQTLDDFDAWFLRNGKLAVFATRLIPEIRALASYPAGFARMPMKDFFPYSLAGMVIWNTVLFVFGYYVISTTSISITMGGIGVFILLLYFVYVTFLKHIGKRGSKA